MHGRRRAGPIITRSAKTENGARRKTKIKPPSKGHGPFRAGHSLEFNDVCALLAEKCKTAPGREASLNLRPAQSRAAAERLLDETAETSKFIESGTVLLPSETGAPDTVLSSIRKGLLPEPEEIAGFMSFLAQAERTESFVRQLASAPALAEVCRDFVALNGLTSFYLSTFSSDGRIRPDASALLMELESRINSIRQRIHAKAERMLGRKEFFEKFQDDYVTIRNDRVVLPVKAEYKNVFPGIIHGISASDKTVFIEPQELVADNNLLREAFAERDAETYRLMREAARLVMADEVPVREDHEIIGRLDSIWARALFSAVLQGKRPEFSDDGPVRLLSARHPLMVATGEDPVANDVLMGREERTLVISGPNAGGKTVMLKSIGLCVMLSECGVFPPVAAGTTFPYPKRLYALVGDEQSISEGESTFTAQLGGIKEALEGAGDGTWIIVDEILNGTDPAQAAVLAEAVLEHFAAKGCLTFVSTHLPGLKMAAQENPAMVNAAMGFGGSEFKLEKGRPGVSNPLDVAASAGIPEKILSSARAKLSDTRDRYQAALADLAKKSAEAEALAARYTRLEESVARREAELSAKLEETAKSREEFEREKRKKLKAEVAKAREEISILAQQAREGDARLKAETARKLKEMETALIVEIHRPDSAPLESLKEGASVWITPLDRKATLVRFSGGKAEVICGEARMTVDVKDIIGVGEEGARKIGRKPPGGAPPATGSVEINLMGLTGEEAVEALDKHLDTQYMAGTDRVKVVHGRSVLRGKVGEYLKTSRYVKTFLPGSIAEGGDAVSIVELKE